MYRSPYLQGYIDLSLEVIEDGDAFMAEKLHDIIISVFENEIETVFDRTSGAEKAGGHIDDYNKEGQNETIICFGTFILYGFVHWRLCSRRRNPSSVK